MAIHFKGRSVQVAIETEATQGTAETLVAADIPCRIGNPVLDLPFEIHEQDLMQMDLSELSDLVGNEPAMIGFDTKIVGSGTIDTPPGYGEILKPAGFLETINAATSVVYTPETIATSNSCTVGLEVGPTSGTATRLFVIKGARVESLSLRWTPGSPMMLSVRFRGAWSNDLDPATALVPTFDPPDPPVAKNLGLTIGAWTPFINQFQLDIANALHRVDNPGAVSEPSGISHYEIVGRRMSGTMTFLEVNASTRDWIANIRNRTQDAYTSTLGSATGNKMTLDAAKMQFLPGASLGFDGLVGVPLPFKFNRDTGDDEVSFTHT